MKYAEICNKYYVNFPELKFQIKNEGFSGEHDDEFTADMLTFLSGDLTGETPPSKANAIPWDYAGEIKLRPIHKEVKLVAKELPAMLKSLERCVSSDMLRPAMTYIYSTGEKLVATDGHKLITVNFQAEQGFYYTPKEVAKNWKPWKGIEGELKGPGYNVGEVIREADSKIPRYPDYLSVWPEYTGDYEAYRYIDAAKLLSIALAADRARRFFVPGIDTEYLAMLLTWGEKRAYFDNKILVDALTTLLEQGETFLKLRMSRPDRCIVLEGNSASGLVMPVMWDKEDRPYVRIDL